MSHTQLLVFSSVRLVLLRLTALPILLSAILPPALAAPAVVTPTSGLVTIESDLQKADNSTGVVTATGNVRIVYPDQRVVATARQAQYFSREGRVVLSGDVDVIQDSGHSIRAERLVYLVERERIVAQPAPGQQVITFYRMNAPTPKEGLMP
ncbi:MAG: LPS-assembly protein LptD [Prochlorococcaceae cyanobacterium MAG_34]|jgi:lipopolysaccharide export system protein LptA|nr:LPS-assembly protein LptD [Cyanobium sp. MAG_237]MDP5119451.1 LPS-assembly protein LptD [Prochlorococcaceae cyanobacterium MAG_34]PHX68341.1 MAG: organic solvent tolerance protein OstA [Cyanobium sp. Baikal-G2]